MIYYTLVLPVYKQGDDLAHFLEVNGDEPIKSFFDLAEQYKRAAETCEKVSKILAKSKNINLIEINACTHSIIFCGPKNSLLSLIKENLIVKES